MRDVIATMQEIKTQSQKITDIIKVIDDIAFQTNLLALNAAVEAGAPGEPRHGALPWWRRGGACRNAAAWRPGRFAARSLASVQGVERGSTLVGPGGRTARGCRYRAPCEIQVVSLITAIKQEAGQVPRHCPDRRGRAPAWTQPRNRTALVDDNSSASDRHEEPGQAPAEVIHQFRLAPDRPLSAGDAPLLAAQACLLRRPGGPRGSRAQPAIRPDSLAEARARIR